MAKKKIETNNLTAVRIRELREKNNWSQKYLAEKLEKTEQMVRRYEHGDTGVSDDTVMKMSKLFYVLPEYLRGETKCKTYAEYRRELAGSESEALEEYEKDRRILSDFLEKYCGYKCFEDVMAIFADLGGYEDIKNPYHGMEEYPVRLSKSGGVEGKIVTGKDFFFSYEEIDALIRKIKDLVDFECFKKMQKEES